MLCREMVKGCRVECCVFGSGFEVKKIFCGDMSHICVGDHHNLLRLKKCAVLNEVKLCFCFRAPLKINYITYFDKCHPFRHYDSVSNDISIINIYFIEN